MVMDTLIGPDELILVTGSAGFIGTKVVDILLNHGFRNLRCFIRSSSDLSSLKKVIPAHGDTKVQLTMGNLLSRDDCRKATEDVSVIFHLAAGVEKTFPGCFMDSVVATRNLLDAVRENGNLKRFVNVSSLAVYSNRETNRCEQLDEESEVEKDPALRHEAYAYGKVKQEELVLDYAGKYGIPYVMVRPGDVFGPGKRKLSGKVGIDTFGIFLHLGGRNIIPFTYVDNCAEAIVMAGIKKGVNGEIFNIIDDNLPTSRAFLKMYKREVKYFKSIYIPYGLLYFLCYLWEKYSEWSNGQLPPAFNRKRCIAHWKGTRYTNKKAKAVLGWQPRVRFDEAVTRYFEYMKKGENN